MTPRAWLLMAMLGIPLLAAAAEDCRQTVLQDMGWRVASDDVPTVQIHGGEVCRRADLTEAHAAGDLRITLPRHMAGAIPGHYLDGLSRDPASICAYAMQVGTAARRAASALQANSGYRFSALQAGWISFGLRGAQAQGWESFRSFGRGYRPLASNSGALQAFYTGRVRSECGVGRQVAQLATLRELHGDAAYDRLFTADELSIGTFLGLHDTGSILLGAAAGELRGDGKGARAAAQGQQAFVGVPGFLVHARGRELLDDLNNQAENFIVVDVGVQAADALGAHAGLRWYDGINEAIWALSRKIPRRGVRFFERLLAEREPALRASLTPDEHETLSRMEALLDDPFYRQFLIYSHPRGIKPIGYHVIRLLDRNPRTPYVIELALHNLHTTLYQRWWDSRITQCAAGREATDFPGTGDASRPVSTTER